MKINNHKEIIQKRRYYNIKTFIKDNILPIIIIIIMGLLTYGIKLITYSFSIDTEAFLTNREAVLQSWISISRYGLVFIKKIIDIPFINLYIANFVGFILLSVALLCR